MQQRTNKQVKYNLPRITFEHVTQKTNTREQNKFYNAVKKNIKLVRDSSK